MFLSTRDLNYLYKFIVGASKENCEKLLKKKLELLIFKRHNYPSLNFVIFFFYLLISGQLFNKNKRALIHYKNIEIGRFIISHTLTKFETYVNKRVFYYYLFKNFFLAGAIIKTCEDYHKNNKIEGLYIDHCGYINGVIFSYFAKKRVPIYTNNYPKGVFGIDYRKKSNTKIINYEKALKIKRKINFNKSIRNIANKCLKDLTQKKNFIPWLDKCKFQSIDKINFKKFDYVIYTHSFTDGQLWYGYDGFENTLDWLIFTIDKLTKRGKKILIKPHPNFFNKSLTIFSKWDKKIFYIVREKYKNSRNTFFLKKPIHNFELLKKLNDDCILITKYGSVLLESSFMNYKTICSENNFFESKFKISNTWKNIEEYEKILDKDYKNLSSCNQEDLHLLIYHLFYIYDSPYNSKNYFVNIIRKSVKMNIDTFKNFFYLKARSKLSNSKNKFFNSLFNKKNNVIIKKISDRIYL